MLNFLKRIFFGERTIKVISTPIYLQYHHERIFDDFFRMVQNLRNDYLEALGETAKYYPTNDVRYRFFDKMLAAIYTLQVNASFVTGIYDDPKNRSKLLYPFQYTHDVIEDESRYFLKIVSMQTFFLFFHYAFSGIESSIRILVIYLDVPVDKKLIREGRGNIEVIIKFIFDELTLNPEYKEAIFFLRLVRDTIHNRGTYNPIDGTDKSITYKGKTYNFIVGKQVDFANGEAVFPVLTDLIRMYQDIISHPKVKRIDFMLDPYM